MKRLWLRWLGLLAFVAVLAVLFVHLGEWQLDRLDTRRENNAHVTKNQSNPVVGYQDVFVGGAVSKADEWQRVSVSGEFATGKQIVVRYRSHDSEQGAELVAPLLTDEGDWVLIDRGFIVRQTGETDPTVIPDLPSGRVVLTGYAKVSEQGKDTATVPVEDRARLINASAMSTYWGLDLLDGYVAVIDADPAEPADLLPVTPPALDEGPHFWYAVQWFCFTAIAGGGFIVLVRADLRDRKKAEAKARRLAAESAVAAPPPDPAGAGGEPANDPGEGSPR